MKRFALAPGVTVAMALLAAVPISADTTSLPVLPVPELQALAADNTSFAATDPNPTSLHLSVSFFVGAVGPLHPGQASWTNTVSNDTDPYSAQLDVPEGGTPADGFSSFAGINFHHIAGHPAPSTSPTFDFMADKSGASGGSPRLVVQFSSPANTTLYIDLRPLAWTANTWTTEGTGGQSSDWDLMTSPGTGCAFMYEQMYSAVIAAINTCDPGAVVTAAYIVTDSGWVAPPGGAPYTNWIDNIQYSGTVISQPSDNSQ